MREKSIKRKLYLSNKTPAIMFSTNVINEPPENNNRQMISWKFLFENS